MPSKTAYADIASAARAIRYARGKSPAEVCVRDVNVLDVFSGRFVTTDIAWAEGRIVGLGGDYQGFSEIDGSGLFAVPGFIDAHVHIESSLMTPARFAEIVLPCGTTTAIWDPHEIANVWGVEGIRWAIEASEGHTLDVFIMIPSCVPSTSRSLELESSGAYLSPADLRPFRQHPRVLGLAEMMNFPGLLDQDSEVLEKLLDFQNLRLDGHCPGLSGHDLNAYAMAGIHSCHESTTLLEAQEKMLKGIHVLIREGSCAKDAKALIPLINAFSSSNLALCSDDRNPLDILEQGHISYIIDLALRAGKSPEEVFRSASYGAAQIYGLNDRGAIAPAYWADLCLVRPQSGDWKNGFELEAVFKRGKRIGPDTFSHVPSVKARKNLHLKPPQLEDLAIRSPKIADHLEVRVIGIIPNQILTHDERAQLTLVKGEVRADPERDILKIAVFERHHNLGTSCVGFVRGFGITHGAIATSINHDSHNLICVGSSEALMLRALEELIRIDGGIVVVSERGETETLPLPIAGLMTDASPQWVAERLKVLKALTRAIACRLDEPFLQLSFLALPVIPALKISDRGLIDVSTFSKVSVLI